MLQTAAASWDKKEQQMFAAAEITPFKIIQQTDSKGTVRYVCLFTQFVFVGCS